MAETEKINKIIFDIGGIEYEFDGGGGGSQPGPNTVGTEELKDGAVEMQDLHEDVAGKIQKTYIEGDEALQMDYDVANDSTSQSGASGAPAMTEEEEE